MRRGWVISIFGIALAFKTLGAPEAVEVNLDYVARLALARAQQPFHSPRASLPAVLNQTNLDYDKYREIRFVPGKALWTEDDLPFRVNFFHLGYIYQEPVHVNEFTATHTQPIPFNQDFFDYGNLTIKNQIPRNTGYAGFRLFYPLNKTNQFDELGAFLGASYFRLLGAGQTYGLSARGLALDCGETDRTEEFPIFTDWWLGKPDKDARTLTLYAILDSVSCAGAYEFQIRPGQTTAADISAVLYFREPNRILQASLTQPPIKTVGLAPLTSMFWFGKNSERKFDDYRPEVHNSDGLMVELANGQRLWQPLDNPLNVRHQIFPGSNVRGYGLMQRERSFSAYQDLFTTYQDEPSVWVEPRGTNWNNGDLHLVELYDPWEYNDNIVAFWSPKTVPQPLQPYRFAYALYWTRETDRKFSPQDKVVATRIGQFDPNADARQIFIDFAGPKLSALSPTNPPVAVVTCGTNAQIVANQVVWNPFENSWRAVLKMQPRNPGPVDLTCTLQRSNVVLSETWSYQWMPP
jgi:periplasmic glucans biosynthesis protein